MLNAAGAWWNWHNSSTGCACALVLSGDFPNNLRNLRDKGVGTWAGCEKGQVGESLKVKYKVMGFFFHFLIHVLLKQQNTLTSLV